MRLTTIGAALVVAGCAGTQAADTTQAAKRACGGIGCFYEREVRDFEVINHTTLIVYVGAERCPYQVELRGTFCDMQFATEVYFNSSAERHTTSPAGVNDSVLAPAPGSPQYELGSSSNHLSDLKICSNDISIGVSGGAFTRNPTNNQTRTSDCQISSVASLTDDKLMELYVRAGVVPPPPPMGAGQIQVGAQSTSPSGGVGVAGAAETGAGAGAGAPPSNPPQGNPPPGAGSASQLDSADRK
jgi:hypothetical protein